MKRLAPWILVCGLMAGTSAHAALPLGAPAPDFSVPASLGGNEFTFKLNEALKQGPVVLYFFPAAFSHSLANQRTRISALVPLAEISDLMRDW